ncbi:YihY/virulence factor BrkB family protein [Thermasporomyces composti]|uniref:Membrane protein n=1 Tax=Thermasporomyces composti TaxID=696763 RepID=A0A3D9V8W1_THECX|nr:YihY/virulence factor BrkB family protein [Thermasporomyces composti]REF38202.1 membrane protein [Thermasporomyces composti]
MNVPSARRAGGRLRRGLRSWLPWRLLRGTVASCLRYRVTGLAAEGAFFAILSLPPLVFGLAGSIGYVVGGFGESTVETVKAELVELARQALTEESVQRVIVPTLDAVLERGRADVISVGFVLALWSGSRALNVLIDTIAIMHGLGGRRGIVRTRVLSFTLYVAALAMAVSVIPLVLAGPSLVNAVLPERLDVLNLLYWPTVVVASTTSLTSLYHVAVPARTPWRHNFAGAVVAMLLWIGGGSVLRWVLGHAIGGTSIYGPLAAPIVILLWLYLVVIALLIGAAFAATVNELAQHREPSARRRAGSRQPGPGVEPATPEGATADGAFADPYDSEPTVTPDERVVEAARRAEAERARPGRPVDHDGATEAGASTVPMNAQPNPIARPDSSAQTK